MAERGPKVKTPIRHPATIINSGGRKIAALLILAEEGYLDKERVIELSNRDPADLRDALSKI